MKNRSRCVLILSLGLVASLLFASPAAVEGAEAPVQVFRIDQVDDDGDGLPDVSIILCSFGSPSDRVSVYDGGDDMRAGWDWMEITDFANDTWVFDAGADGTAQLIVRFSEDNGRSVAMLYDDQDNDGQVAHRLDSGQVIVTESSNWSLRVEADGSWLLPDGFPNQNLRFFTDGKLDRWSEIVDIDRDGIPEHEVWNLFAADAKPGRQGASPGIWVNRTASRPALLVEHLFWPLLATAGDPEPHSKFDLTPFVTVDWQAGKLAGTSIGKASSGYPIEAGYFVLSFGPWQAGHLNYANFENPMAYYDLAEDQDGLPELHVRLEHFAAHDPRLDVGPAAVALSDVRYSWAGGDPAGLYWKYKVGLAGSHDLSSASWFGAFGVQTPDYDGLPKWVSDRHWAWGTLVVNEDPLLNTPSSEGLYDWPATLEILEDVRVPDSRIVGSQKEVRRYLIGATASPPDRFYRQIRAGFRGEFGYLEDRPLLYVSAIDGRLHLRRATQGVWNIDDDAEIRYANLDGDGYLDQWSYYEGGVLRRRLVAAQSHLIYAGENQVVLKRARVTPFLFEAFPPRNHQEWLELGPRLQTHQHGIPPIDFGAMVTRFDGPETVVSGATLRDYRPMDSGFRFVLELEPGFGVEGDDLLGVGGREPGRYLVRYDGAFTCVPLTPPELHLTALGHGWEPMVAYSAGKIRVVVENAALADASTVLVKVQAWQPGIAPVVETTQTLRVLSGESERAAFAWAPGAPGAWSVQVRASALDGDGSTMAEAVSGWEVDVAPAEEPSVEDALGAFGLVQPAVPLLLLASAAAAGSLTVFATLRAARDESSQQPSSQEDWKPQ